MAVGNSARLPAAVSHPDFLFCPSGITGGIWDLAAAIGTSAASEKNRRAIWFPRDIVNFLAIVPGKLRPGNAFVFGGAGNPHIARSPLVLYPGDCIVSG